MPTMPKRDSPKQESLAASSYSEVDGATLLQELLDAPIWSRDAITKQDWRTLSKQEQDELIIWYNKRYKLDPSLGYVCLIKTKDGRLLPYIKAQGIFEIARPKTKSIDLNEPQIIFDKGHPSYVTIISRVETIDNKFFSNIACCKVTGDLEIKIRTVATSAMVRALKVAVGITLLTENDAQLIEQQGDSNGKQ